MTLEVFIATYGYYAIALGACFEGETILVLGGLAAHQGYLSFPGVLACAFAATLATDHLYFYLGRHNGLAFLTRRPRWQAKSARVMDLIRRYQTPLALFFRFLYGLRAIVPFSLGLSGISRLRFALFDLLGSIAWVSFYGALGFFFGRTGQALLQELPRKEYILFAAVAVIGGLLWVRYRWRLRRAIRAAAADKKTPA